MQTELCHKLRCDAPIFAFSHCRDVVRAVSVAGGLGVYGVNLLTPDELDRELAALERELEGYPYGVDVLYPLTSADDSPQVPADPLIQIPSTHRDFVCAIGDAAGVTGEWMSAYEDPNLADNLPNTTRERTDALLEVILSHSPSLLVSALGPLPRGVVDRAHESGMLIGGMVGAPKHAIRHVDAGADVVIAQGSEAGGHTGEISTMVLTPQVVDAVHPVPVVTAGGIADGRHLAAALALGAQGVWAGSVWLTTYESDLEPEVIEKLLQASSASTVKTRSLTGKPCRSLVDAFNSAWASEEAPQALPMPWQELLVRPLLREIRRHRKVEYMGTPVGQVVGEIESRRRSSDVVFAMMSECIDMIGRLSAGYPGAE